MDNHVEAKKFIAENHSFFSGLADRWQDEKEYEDWNEYIEAARKRVEDAQLIFIKMKKRPFACVFRVSEKWERDVDYHLVVTKTKVRLDIHEPVAS